ncbi:hypothetical protein BS78_K195500 [Paspalum vaginatum]|uniref:NB-ARC domain-containing protein n=1 Tax=Paspalum vaginatum TaxID=158149 RepID=A0A9W7XEH1_9POAL|nr:hypothetical protein BS78_K195500 [Paspalum vaginatum]
MSVLYKRADSLVGISDARDELIRRLTEGDGDVHSRQLKIVSLVGPAGVGKTTLAKVLYDNFRPSFHCTAFVPFSPTPSMKKVLLSICKVLGITEYQDDMHKASWGQTKIINDLQNFLQNKRYLIILDDIWETKSWTTIKQALVNNNHGSIIVTTTRMQA